MNELEQEVDGPACRTGHSIPPRHAGARPQRQPLWRPLTLFSPHPRAEEERPCRQRMAVEPQCNFPDAAHYATLRFGVRERLDFTSSGCANSTKTTALCGTHDPCISQGFRVLTTQAYGEDR